MLPITETNEIKKIIAEQFGVNVKEITNETEFIKDLGADSLDTVEVVMGVEDFLGKEGFEIHISDEDVEKITTVGSMIEYIEEKKAKAMAERR